MKVTSATSPVLQVFDCRDGASAPDMQFGIFAAVFGPPGSGMEDQALVAINIGGQQAVLQL